MARLILSNLVLAYVAFVLGTYWPQEVPRPLTLRYPPPTCGAEMERLRSENQRLEARVSELRGQLRQKEDIPAIVRETVRILLEGQPQL